MFLFLETRGKQKILTILGISFTSQSRIRRIF